MELIERESVEWTNSWISNANKNGKRCLLIGDSTTRQIRSSLEFLAMGYFAVDLFASSYAIQDHKFMEYLKLFFQGDEYTYDVIFLQYGAHHNFVHECNNDQVYKKKYWMKYKDIVIFLKEKCKNVIILSSTAEAPWSEREKEVIVRNVIARDVANQLECRFYDIYELMKKSGYIHFDRCHYQRESDAFISYHLLLFLLSEGVISKDFRERACGNNRREIQNKFGNEKIFIYGKGIRGQELYWWFKWNNMEKSIECFVETNIVSTEFFNIPVVQIDTVDNVNKQKLLVISSEKFETEMRKRAEELGFENIITAIEFKNATRL